MLDSWAVDELKNIDTDIQLDVSRETRLGKPLKSERVAVTELLENLSAFEQENVNDKSSSMD